MKHSNKINNVFAILIGSFLLIGGIWGLFSDQVFGFLTTNGIHSVIQIVFGIAGIVLGLKQNAGGYCTFLGIILILMGIFRFIPGAGDYLVRILNVNVSVALLNIIVGVLSLAVVYYRRPGELKN